jgi:tetratricopeptide (TPR) repeat protein
MINFYNLLKVSTTAAEEEIKKAINRELRVWSNRTNAPQIERRQEAERMVKQLEEAERILLDAARRKEYDLQLQAAPTPTGRVDETVIHEGVDLVQEGWRLLIAGNIAEAIFVATQATQRDSGNPEAWALLGQAKYRWGEIEDAIYEYKRAINLRPNDPSYYFDLGCVYESAERWQDALLQFQRAAQIDPSTTMYRAAIGAILIKNEKYQEGIEILERCVQEEPDNASYKWYLAIAYLESRFAGWVFDPEDRTYLCISKGQADTAKALVQKAKALNVEDPELAAEIGKADAGVEDLYKRRFTGSWIMVGFWTLCYIVPGILWYLVNLRPNYKINRDIYEVTQEGKKSHLLVGGEAAVYISALPPGIRGIILHFNLPRFVVWFLVLLLSPVTFLYLLYDNYLSEGGSISLHDLGLSREKAPVAAAIGLGVVILVAIFSAMFWWSGRKTPITTSTYYSHAPTIKEPERPDYTPPQKKKTDTMAKIPPSTPPSLPPKPPAQTDQLALTREQLNSSIINFYKSRGEWAGIFEIDYIEKVRIENISPNFKKVHVRYRFKPIPGNRAGRTDTGYDQRVFIVKKIGGSFEVTQMLGHMSAVF